MSAGSQPQIPSEERLAGCSKRLFSKAAASEEAIVLWDVRCASERNDLPCEVASARRGTLLADLFNALIALLLHESDSAMSRTELTAYETY